MRNWKWFVPVGCFSIALLFVAFVCSVVLIVFSAIKSTNVYKDALARAKAHPAVIEVLGSLSRTDFCSQETQTSTPLRVNRTSPFPSPVQTEKEQFTQRQLSRLVDGTILGSSWKSKKRINESIFSKSRRL